MTQPDSMRLEFKIYGKIIVLVLLVLLVVHYLYHIYEIYRFAQGASKKVITESNIIGR